MSEISSEKFRLVWFQHFHKAAGSSIVSIAAKNGEVLYPNHLNGNPIDNAGNYIPVWNYNHTDLLQFIDHCEEIGCTFIAPEWGVADLHVLKADPRVKIVTCIRDPYARFISNYVFDYRLGYTDHNNVRNYVGSKRSFSYFNYYTHTLAKLADRVRTASESDFRKARGMLECFDQVQIVGTRGWLIRLCNSLGWDSLNVKANRRRPAAVEIVSNLLCGRPQLAKRVYRSTRLTIDKSFKREFIGGNGWDYKLFNLATKISREPTS